MEIAWRGYAEQKAVTRRARQAHCRDPRPCASRRRQGARREARIARRRRTRASAGESGTLASLETSAEGSDSAPTPALRQTALETIAQLNADWAAWQQIKSSDLEALNRRLAAAGLQPVVVPGRSRAQRRPPPREGSTSPERARRSADQGVFIGSTGSPRRPDRDLQAAAAELVRSPAAHASAPMLCAHARAQAGPCEAPLRAGWRVPGGGRHRARAPRMPRFASFARKSA